MSTLQRRRVASSQQPNNTSSDNNNHDSQSNTEHDEAPELTLMDQVLLLGLKDKQVPNKSNRRATCHSGTIASLMLCAGAFSLSWHLEAVLACRCAKPAHSGAHRHLWPIVQSKSSLIA